MAGNKKITELTAMTTPDDTDVMPIADVSLPETKKITWANIKASFTDFILSFFGPVSLTVSQAQAMAGGTPTYFTPGRRYKITDAYDQGGGDLAVITIVAASTTTLEDCGFGTFKNAAMTDAVSCQMWYDLAADKIYRIYEPTQNNDVSVSDNFTSINRFLFDNTSWVDNRFVNVHVTAGFDADSTMDGCILTNCEVTMDIEFHFTNCRIGSGKTVTISALTSGYTQSGSVYDGDRSTFTITSADSSDVNPDGSNIIDMDSFKFAGILIVDDGTNDLISFANIPTDHEWEIRGEVGSAVALYVVDGSGIYFNVAMPAITSPFGIIEGKASWATFRSDYVTSTDVQMIFAYSR